MGFWVVLLGSLSVISFVSGASINNGVSGDPEVECASDSILVNFNTEDSFEGHVYVKGQYDTAGCRTDATLSRAASITVPFSACGARRQRTTQGLYVSTTIVITFHPMFITMVDKAYNVRCFYMEADKTVDTQLEVSMLTTQIITQTIPMPTCKYEVLEDDANGALVSYATVGQTVYHKWTCEAESGSEGIFCMTVHSCFVKNSEERQVQLLDEEGCAVDKYLLTNLDYSDDLVAGQESMVFKFADKASLFFQCQIRLSLKEGDTCSRTSDSCPDPIRGKRDVEEEKGENVDVFSETITVFDIDDPITERLDALEIDRLNARRRTPTFVNQSETVDERSPLCLSPISFGILIGVLVVVLVTSLVTVAIVCTRYRNSSELKRLPH